MIDFRPVALADKPWMDELFAAENSQSADYNFGNIYMWDVMYKQLVARVGDRVLVKPTYAEGCFYAFPVGYGELKPAVDALIENPCECGCRLTLRGVEERHRAMLEELYPGRWEFSEDRDYFDYIYLAEKLASLSGKKLHGKRGHINRFLAEQPSWEFLPLSTALIPECVELLDNWAPHSAENYDLGLAAEHGAIMRGFRHFDELGLMGGALFAGGRMVAFTVAERTSADTVNIHFEKAYADVNGAYPMINREFIRYLRDLLPGLVYVNREDDAGLESLRRAKLSYAPERLLVKYTAAWR